MPRSPTLLILAAFALCAVSVTAHGNELRDPTRPYSATPPRADNAGPFQVSAVFVATDRRVAIVNGKRVVEGDTVAGATVTAIYDNRVQLNRDGKVIVVRLLPGTPRK